MNIHSPEHPKFVSQKDRDYAEALRVWQAATSQRERIELMGHTITRLENALTEVMRLHEYSSAQGIAPRVTFLAEWCNGELARLRQVYAQARNDEDAARRAVPETREE